MPHLQCNGPLEPAPSGIVDGAQGSVRNEGKRFDPYKGGHTAMQGGANTLPGSEGLQMVHLMK